MTRAALAIPATVVGALALAAPGRAQEDPVPEAAVLAELDAYYQDFSARDWTAFAQHFWPGATITSAWQPPGEDSLRVVVTPVPEFVAQAPSGPGSREIFEERMTGAVVQMGNGLAQVWAGYRARFGDPGEVMEWTGTDAFTLIELHGQWKIVSLAFASHDDTSARSPMLIESLTPILYVDAIEPLLPFWVDRLGFARSSEVMENDRLGFIILQRDDAQLMIQTRASMEADLPAIAGTPLGAGILYLRVRDLDAMEEALRGADVVVPRRTTPYGAEEIFVRDPGGNVVGFAAFPDPED